MLCSAQFMALKQEKTRYKARDSLWNDGHKDEPRTSRAARLRSFFTVILSRLISGFPSIQIMAMIMLCSAQFMALKQEKTRYKARDSLWNDGHKDEPRTSRAARLRSFFTVILSRLISGFPSIQIMAMIMLCSAQFMALKQEKTRYKARDPLWNDGHRDQPRTSRAAIISLKSCKPFHLTKRPGLE